MIVSLTSVQPPYITSRRRDIRHGLGFFANFTFAPNRKEYRSAKIWWKFSNTHSLQFNEICRGPISGATFLHTSGKDTEIVLYTS